MTRSRNVTPKTTLHGGKSNDNKKKSARVTILLRLTTDGHKASRGLSPIVELLVSSSSSKKRRPCCSEQRDLFFVAIWRIIQNILKHVLC